MDRHARTVPSVQRRKGEGIRIPSAPFISPPLNTLLTLVVLIQACLHSNEAWRQDVAAKSRRHLMPYSSAPHLVRFTCGHPAPSSCS